MNINKIPIIVHVFGIICSLGILSGLLYGAYYFSPIPVGKCLSWCWSTLFLAVFAIKLLIFLGYLCFLVDLYRIKKRSRYIALV